jgi:hypothetical protein
MSLFDVSYILGIALDVWGAGIAAFVRSRHVDSRRLVGVGFSAGCVALYEFSDINHSAYTYRTPGRWRPNISHHLCPLKGSFFWTRHFLTRIRGTLTSNQCSALCLLS